MIFTPGNAIVNSTSLDCRSCCPMVDVRSANGYPPIILALSDVVFVRVSIDDLHIPLD